MTLKEIGFEPNQLVSKLSNEGFKVLFMKYTEELYLYKGKRLIEIQAFKTIELLYFKMRGKYQTITCNDIAFIFEQEFNSSVFNRITTEYLNNRIHEVFLKTEASVDTSAKVEKVGDPLWCAAIQLRLQYDKNGAKIEEGVYTLKQVFDSLKAGYNFYTGEIINS